MEIEAVDWRAHADLILVAEVTSAEVRWAEGPRGGLETIVWLAPREIRQGEPGRSALQLVLGGGEMDGHFTRVEGVPELETDRAYLLHLVSTPSGWQIIGGERGAALVDDGIPRFYYEVNSNDWAWAEGPVPEPFEINVSSFSDVGSADEIRGAFSDALAVWNEEAGAGLYIEDGGASTVTDQGGGNDDHNVTLWGERSWGAGLAVATTNGYDGELSDCDIQVWESNAYGTIDWHLGEETAPNGAFDIRNTLAHEVGHCLGMGHSDLDEALMYGYNVDGTGEDSRHLSDDDIEGIRYLYGEVSPELVAEALVDGPPGAGEAFDLVVTVRNAGDGTAWDVAVDVSGSGPVGAGAAEAGPVPSDDAVGAKIGPSEVEVRVPLQVGPNCEIGSVDLDVVLTASNGGPWTSAVTVPLACGEEDEDGRPDRPEDEEETAGGCACDGVSRVSGGVSGGVGAWLLVLPALFGLRRRR